jgi:hypothetical protein
MGHGQNLADSFDELLEMLGPVIFPGCKNLEGPFQSVLTGRVVSFLVSTYTGIGYVVHNGATPVSAYGYA